MEESLGDKLKISKSQGGLNFFLELPRGYSSQAFYNFMIQKGVCITPGTYFFDNIMDDRFFRINIANEKIEDIEKIEQEKLAGYIVSTNKAEALKLAKYLRDKYRLSEKLTEQNKHRQIHQYMQK